jgi:hypothetical protein
MSPKVHHWIHKDVSNDMFLVLYNLTFIDQIVKQSFGSEYLVALYIKTEGVLLYSKVPFWALQGAK